jgi:hypothetical protein
VATEMGRLTRPLWRWGIVSAVLAATGGSDGLVPRYWCLAGRYAIKAVARQLDTAYQQIAAQYRMLTG